MNVFQSQLLINEEPEIDLHNRLSEGELSGFDEAGRIDPMGDYCKLVGKFHNPYIRRQVSVEEFLGIK